MIHKDNFKEVLRLLGFTSDGVNLANAQASTAAAKRERERERE